MRGWERIKKGKKDGFYKGEVAELIVAEMKKSKGLIISSSIEIITLGEREFHCYSIG